MRRLIRNIWLALVALVVTTSCEFDHLYYQTNLLALVRINVDWSNTHLSPNGVSAYAYDANGNLQSEVLSSDPNVVFMRLPAGIYTIVLHNNSILELDGLELRGIKQLATSSIYAVERSGSPSFDIEDNDLDSPTLVEEPDEAASYTLREVEIKSSDIAYHYYKPNLSDYEQECLNIYTAKPKHIVDLARIIVRIGGLENASGVPTAVLSGMSGGYRFDAETTAEESVMEELKVNTRVTKGEDDLDSDDVIYVDYDSFGMHATDTVNRKYYLDLHFNLVDGSTKKYHLDVTNNVSTDSVGFVNRHTVDVSLESLPDVEGGDDTGDSYEDGTFDPSLDDWLDVEVELPM